MQQNTSGRPEKYLKAKAVVFQLRADDRTASGAVLSKRLRAHGQAQGWPESDLPPAGELKANGDPREGRTLARWIQEFDRKPDLEKAAYALYIWPGSHQTGAVPWEAQRIARYIKRLMASEGRTPTVHVIRWAYSLTMAAPEMPWYVEPNPQLPHDKSRFCVYHVARNLAANEPEGVRTSLIYRLSFPIEERVTYAQVVDDLLDRELWRDDTPTHELETHGQLERRGPFAIFGRAGATPVEALADLGLTAEEIEQVVSGKVVWASATDPGTEVRDAFAGQRSTSREPFITDLGDKKPGEPWAYEKNRQEDPVPPAPKARRKK